MASHAPPEGDTLRLIVSDCVGQLKALEGPAATPDKLTQVSVWGKPSREAAIGCIAIAETSSTGKSCTRAAAPWIALARDQGTCELADMHSGRQLSNLSASTSGKSKAANKIKSVHFLWSTPESAKLPTRRPLVLTCTFSGHARLYALSADSAEEEQLQHEEIASWQLPPNIAATAIDESYGIKMAVACEGKELTVWDVATAICEYQAKSQKPNAIGLVDKPCNTAVVFLPSNQEGHRVLVGTKTSKLALYDCKNRRPRFAVAFREGKITALAPDACGSRCWVGNARGEVGCLDVEKGVMQQVLKGIAGSVSSLAIHPSLPLLASVGLDRHLRVHDIANRKLLARVYLKQQLTGVAFCKAKEAHKTGAEETYEGVDRAQAQKEQNSDAVEQEQKWSRSITSSSEVSDDSDAETSGESSDSEPVVKRSNKKQRR